MPRFQINMVVAHSWPEFGIGMSGGLPWSLKSDLQHFKRVTLGTKDPGQINAVIMGRKTYESLPAAYKPLPGRINIVLTNNPPEPLDNKIDITKPIYVNANILMSTLEFLYLNCNLNAVFIIGGTSIYCWALDNLVLNEVYITEIYQNEKKDMSKYDTFFPEYDHTKWIQSNNNMLHITAVSPIKTENGLNYRFITFMNSDAIAKNNTVRWINPEMQYLNIMNDILVNGVDRGDRTGTGTLALFSTVQKYDLSMGFPLSTTKRMFFRGIFEELALYISGKTDNKILQDKNIHIWDGNTSREFLDKRGLTSYPDGDMGETYGFNFRHYGAEYKTCAVDYGDQGYDQLSNLVNLLKTDPMSRRLIINLWNPATQDKAALPACLMMYQFFVNPHAKTLSCQIYLRSSDYFLANSWNACTGALLVHMLCNIEGIDLVPGWLTVITGDTHIYKTHLDQVNENIIRQPFLPCQLQIKGVKRRDLREFVFEDMRIVGYRAHPSISAPMAV